MRRPKGRRRPAAPLAQQNLACGQLERWLSEALAFAQHSDPGWIATCARAPLARFIVHDTRSARWLIGVLAPSGQRAGEPSLRALHSRVAEEVFAGDYPCIAHHRFFDDTAQLLAHDPPLDSGALRARFSALRPADPAALATARSAHRWFIEHADCARAFGPAFRNTWPDQHERALSLLRTACSSITAQPQLTRHGIRCPLDPAAPGQTVGLWLELTRRLIRNPSQAAIVPAALWTDHALLIYLGSLSRRALLALWRPDWQDETICDLGRTDVAVRSAELIADRPLRALLP